VQSEEWATAVADGIISRSEPGIVVLDLDGDGDERTGWVVFYLHVGRQGQIAQGTRVKTGDRIGHPSCEGGSSTGTHIHIARKFNSEWITAGGSLAFNLEGWVAHAGSQPYEGTLTNQSQTVTACLCSNKESQIESQP
jgi:murein DD-endopeptidase MepM/ murein hydrolase activator NlpD